MWFSSNSRQIILLIVKTTYIYVISSSQKSVVVTFTVVSMPLVHSSLLLYILYILYVSKSVWQKKINRCENKNIFLHRKTDYKLYIFIVYSCKIDMKQQLIVVVELPTQNFLKIARIFMYSLINMRQLHIFSIKPKLDMRLFVDFCVFTWIWLNLPDRNIRLFWTSKQNNFRLV